MEEAIPPWGPPAVRCVPDSGAGKWNAGKPLETMGRKARGWGAVFCTTLVRLRSGKPMETLRRKARG